MPLFRQKGPRLFVDVNVVFCCVCCDDHWVDAKAIFVNVKLWAIMHVNEV